MAASRAETASLADWNRGGKQNFRRLQQRANRSENSRPRVLPEARRHRLPRHPLCRQG